MTRILSSDPAGYSGDELKDIVVPWWRCVRLYGGSYRVAIEFTERKRRLAMADWQDISTAPKNGTTIRTRRIIDGEVLFERMASWRDVTFPAFISDGMSIPPETVIGWMYPDIDKRIPEPTHWMPL